MCFVSVIAGRLCGCERSHCFVGVASLLEEVQRCQVRCGLQRLFSFFIESGDWPLGENLVFCHSLLTFLPDISHSI